MTARILDPLRVTFAAGSYCPPATDARVRKFGQQPRVIARREDWNQAESAGVEAERVR
jgi:hypothetical protein